MEEELDPRGYLTEGPDASGKRPWAMYEAHDGTVYYGAAAVAASNRDWRAAGYKASNAT